jgi:hypothetical protein
MLAIKKQNLYNVRHLIGKGASKASVDSKGNNVFHYAANTTKDIVKVCDLARRGATVPWYKSYKGRFTRHRTTGFSLFVKIPLKK